MKNIINSGFHSFVVLKCHDCDPDEPTLEFCDTTSAFNFLSMFINDPFNIMILRDVLSESSLCADLYRSSDHDVCQTLACQIASGYIRLVPMVDEIPYALRGEPKEAEASASETAGTTVAPPIPTEVSEQLSEPELEPEVDESPHERLEIQEPALVPLSVAAAQAATMMLAAESGAPFCDT